MIALLDIVLATLAAIATIIAIFGDTWNRRLRRLTRLGWTVVALTTLTFVFGIAKEIVSARSAATDREHDEKEILSLELKLSKANDSLGKLQSAFSEAGKQLVSLSKDNAQLSDRVSKVPAEQHGFVKLNDFGHMREPRGQATAINEQRPVKAYNVLVDQANAKLNVKGGETIKFALYLTKENSEIFEKDFVRIVAGTWQITRPIEDALFEAPIPLRKSRALNQPGWEESFPVVIETPVPRNEWEVAVIVGTPDDWDLQNARRAADAKGQN